MAAIVMREPRVLINPAVQTFLKRAVEHSNLLAPAGFDVLANDLFNFVSDPLQFMFMGAEDGQFKCVCLSYLPMGNLFPYPTVVMFYNEGSRQLSREVQELVMDTMLSKGYTQVLAVNASGHKDEVWQRALTPEGAKSKRVGSLVLFEVK